MRMAHHGFKESRQKCHWSEMPLFKPLSISKQTPHCLEASHKTIVEWIAYRVAFGEMLRSESLHNNFILAILPRLLWPMQVSQFQLLKGILHYALRVNLCSCSFAYSFKNNARWCTMYMYGFFIDTWIIYARWNATPRGRCLALLCIYMYHYVSMHSLSLSKQVPNVHSAYQCITRKSMKRLCEAEDIWVLQAFTSTGLLAELAPLGPRTCLLHWLSHISIHRHVRKIYEHFDVSRLNYLTQMHFLARCLQKMGT